MIDAATVGLDVSEFGKDWNIQTWRFANWVQRPDRWQGPLMPWGMQRYDERCLIPVYGKIAHAVDRDGRYNPMWLDWNFIVGVPHDIPVIGWGGHTVNTLRLYAAQASDEFDSAPAVSLSSMAWPHSWSNTAAISPVLRQPPPER